MPAPAVGEIALVGTRSRGARAQQREAMHPVDDGLVRRRRDVDDFKRFDADRVGQDAVFDRIAVLAFALPDLDEETGSDQPSAAVESASGDDSSDVAPSPRRD